MDPVQNRMLVGFLVLGLAAITTTGVTSGRCDRITWKNINRIRPGMTERHVEEILGVPAGVYNASNPAVPSIPGGKWWIGDGPAVVVFFDEEGKVSDHALLGVDRERNCRHVAIEWLRGALDCLDGTP
jgi:hypothetical protein